MSHRHRRAPGIDASTDASSGDARITILHVDDDPDLLSLTATSLERENDAFEVLTATGVAADLEELDDCVDCVVSDYQMPGEDGLAFLRTVREDYPDLPFILYTGKGSEEIASRAISAGVTDYLQKERGTDQYAILANRIENAVAQYRATRQVERGFHAMATAREGISLLDDEGYFAYVNDAYADIVGYDRADLLGEHWALLYPEENVETIREEILPSIPTDGRWTGETVYVRGDGERILVDHALAYAENGTMICLLRDLSHDGDEGPLVTEDAIVECMLNALDDVFYLLDTEGHIVRFNDRADEVTGFSDEELVGEHACEAVASADRPAVETAIRETLADGESTVEARLLTTDGDEIPHEFRTRRLTDTDGRVIGLVGIGRDVTDRRRRERRLRRQAGQFEAFGSVLSHDLRNPLSVIAGRIGLLADHVDDESVEHLDAIERAVDRLDAMVDELASAMKEGELVSDPQRASTGEAAETAWRALGTESAELVVADAPEIAADPAGLERLFDNVLGNALEHGGDDVTVTVGRLPDGFYVTDDGPGIPPEDRENVFEPGVSGTDDGSGFGLVSVRQIALAHGWDVSVTESADGGARFEITDVEVL